MSTTVEVSKTISEKLIPGKLKDVGGNNLLVDGVRYERCPAEPISQANWGGEDGRSKGSAPL